MSLAKVLNTSKKITLQGKEYTFTELTLGDYADFEEYVREQKRNRIIELAKAIPGSVTKDLLAALNAPPTEKETEAEMSTIGGARYILYLALRKHHDITREQAADLLSLDDLADVMSQITGERAGEKKAEASR